MASMSERPRPHGRRSYLPTVRALGSFALVVFVLLLALGFVR
jgi:hypothetical protein